MSSRQGQNQPSNYRCVFGRLYIFGRKEKEKKKTTGVYRGRGAHCRNHVRLLAFFFPSFILWAQSANFVLRGLLLTLDILLRLSEAWLSTPDYTDEEDPALRLWGANGTGTEELAWYPTNFLQDVVPVPIHSHNDYLRKAPLFTAIRQGCTGVEADVWLFDDLPDKETLFVGHQPASLQPERTFESLYVQPLVKILEHQNPKTAFYNGNWHGVFDANPNQTLALLIDVKTSGSSTWAKVLEQLEPLRQRDWLSYYSDGQVHTRPITVVGTGNTPFEDIVANTTYRDYFFDAPLGKLTTTSPSSSSSPLDTLLPDYDATNSYYASVSINRAIGVPWFGNLGAEQIERIRDQVRAAHARGLKARYWDLPPWPVAARNHIWDLLVKEGVDMLNVDDVKSAAKRNWHS